MPRPLPIPQQKQQRLPGTPAGPQQYQLTDCRCPLGATAAPGASQRLSLMALSAGLIGAPRGPLGVNRVESQKTKGREERAQGERFTFFSSGEVGFCLSISSTLTTLALRGNGKKDIMLRLVCVHFMLKHVYSAYLVMSICQCVDQCEHKMTRLHSKQGIKWILGFDRY